MSAELANTLSTRKQAILELADQLAPERLRWIKRNSYFYHDDWHFMSFLIPEGARVLELGCGIGTLLHFLKPSYGVGVDFSPAMVTEARQRFPHLRFIEGDIENTAILEAIEGPFDYIILSDMIGLLDDCEETLSSLHRLCDRNTRLIIAYYSHLWEPVLKGGARLGLCMPHREHNFLLPADIANLMELADFGVVRFEWRQLLPLRLLGLGSLVNRFVGTLPGIRLACLRNYVVGRSLRHARIDVRSATVVIPCRNERGNIEPAIQRMPQFCPDLEVIFVEGHSRDGTYEEVERVIRAYPDRDIKLIRQDGVGKGDAVFKAFDLARGEVLMILDADLTVPPEQLPKFWNALTSGKGEFINGTRLVYPMEGKAMRFLNLLANITFSWLFTWLLNQRFTDTLCGTKVLLRSDYQRIKANRSYFGNFDPFGDYDLLFGASKLSLRTIEMPIRYANRSYGQTQISRFRHGWLLLRMVVFAYSKLKILKNFRKDRMPL